MHILHRIKKTDRQIDDEMTEISDKNTDDIVLYKSEDGSPAIKVRLREETLWLTQDEIAKLFSRERTVITKHINNVFRTGELDEKSNVKK